MRVRWKYKLSIIAFTFAAIAVGIGLCKNALVCTLATWKLASYAGVPVDTKVNCNGIRFSWNECVLTDVTLSSKQKDLMVAIEECHVDFFADSSSFFPSLFFTISHVAVTQGTDGKIASTVEPNVKEIAFAISDLSKHVAIASATLAVDAIPSLKFALGHDEKTTCLQVFPSSGGSATLYAEEETKNALSLHLECSSLDMSIFDRLLSSIENSLSVQRGEVSGKGKCFLSKEKGIEKWSYAFSMQTLLCNAFGYFLNIDEVGATCNEGQQPEWFARGGSFGIGNDGEQIFVKDVSFFLPAKKEELISGKGLIKHSGLFHPFHIQGLQREEKGGRALEISLSSPLFVTRFELAEKEEEKRAISLELSDCDAELAYALFSLQLHRFFPEKQQIPHLESGILSARVFAEMTSWHITLCEVESLSVSRARGSAGDRAFAADELQGFFRYENGSVPSWGVHVNGGDIPSLAIQGLSLDFALHERYVIPSSFQVEYHGAKIKGGVRGVLPGLKVSVELDNPTEQLIATLFDEYILDETTLSVFSHSSLQANLLVKKTGVHWKGLLHVGKEMKHNEVSFQGKVEGLDSFSLSSLKSGAYSCVFTTKNATDAFLNLPLQLAGEKWRIGGARIVEGAINNKEIALLFPVPELTLRSNVIEIRCQKPLSRAQLFYRFSQKKWEGTIACPDANIFLPKQGLQLSNTAFEAFLEGKEVIIENVITRFVEKESGATFVLGGRGGVKFAASEGIYLDLVTNHIDGTTRCFENLLQHFEDFKEVSLPLAGGLSQNKSQGLWIKAHFTDEEDSVQWFADLHVEEGRYQLTSCSEAVDLTLDVSWDGQTDILTVSNLQGKIQSSYEPLFLRDCAFAMNDGALTQFQCKLDSQTRELVALVGNTGKDGKSLTLNFDPKRSHVFDHSVDGTLLQLSSSYEVERMEFSIEQPISELYTMVKVASILGLASFEYDAMTLFRDALFTGETSCAVVYDKATGKFEASLRGKGIEYGRQAIGDIALFCNKEGTDIKECGISLSSDENGLFSPFVLSSAGKYDAGVVTLEALEIKRKNAYAKLTDVTIDFAKKSATSALHTAYMKLEALRDFFPVQTEGGWEYAVGAITCMGNIAFDWKEGITRPKATANLDVVSSKIGKGDLELLSHHPLQLSWGLDEGITIREIEIAVGKVNDEKHVALLRCEKFTTDFETIDAKQIHLVIPPEISLHLAETETVPYISASGKTLLLGGFEVPWENEIDVHFHLKASAGKVAISGEMKDGYYWAKGMPLHFHDVAFTLDTEKAALQGKIDVGKLPLGISIQTLFKSTFSGNLVLTDLRNDEERLNDSRRTAELAFGPNSSGKTVIKSFECGIFGIDGIFHQNAQRSAEEDLVYSGKLRCHMPFLSTILPEQFQKVISALGMGKGYEVSGDFTLATANVKNSRFTGFIKGKQFELLDARIQTLMGTLEWSKDGFTIDRFIISDEAGELTIPHIECVPNDEGKWALSIPEVTLTDFRPSLLQFIGKYRGKIKPLIVKQLQFSGISGDITDPNSLKGKGSLSFQNTFKKETNLLDIPFEIIARLGIDIGLLVPVKGKIDYELRGGKIFLTNLTESCSEGKRSKFYLSKRVPSYIGLDGEVNVSIKMKQYVILKITEPFVLSITGSVQKPKYSLR